MKTYAIAALLVGLSAAPALAESTQPVQAAAEAASGAQIKKGDSIYSTAGRRLGNVYRLTPGGDPQVIIQSRIVTVPSSIISQVDGKLVASVASSKELLKGK